MLLATTWVSVFGPFRPIFGQKLDPRLPRSHFFPKRIQQKKFQLKIPIFSKSDGGTTWWPNNYKKNLPCGQLRNTQRYQKYIWHVRTFFLEFCTSSSQQCLLSDKLSPFRLFPANFQLLTVTMSSNLTQNNLLLICLAKIFKNRLGKWFKLRQFSLGTLYSLHFAYCNLLWNQFFF